MSTLNKKSITSIFGDMDYNEETDDTATDDNFIFQNNFEKSLISEGNELKNIFIFETIKQAIQNATETEAQWSSASSVSRADFLSNIFFQGSENSKRFKNKFIKENEFFLGLDYFNYYSSIATLTDTYSPKRPGIVFLSLLGAPFYIVTAAVSAALVAGNSVILQTDYHISLCLSQIFSECKIQKGLVNVVAKPVESKDLSDEIEKVIFFGSHSVAQDLYYNSSCCCDFSFLCPNNTSAIILESCDVSAAVDKIVSETWDPDSASMWAVSTAVVQESIYEAFLEKLKFRIKQLKEEKKNHRKFKNEIVHEKIKKITSEAIQAGAVVEEISDQEDKWGPTVIVDYQNQHMELDVPVLNVLVCRTAKEGVALLNNSRYCLGTSIWTEVSAQALQIASMLICKNVWVNCHGVIDSGVPLSPSGFSGNWVFGGQDGLFEFLFFDWEKRETHCKMSNYPYDEFKVLEIAQNAHNAFSKWLPEKNRLKYFKNAENSLKNQGDSLGWFEISLNAQLPGLSGLLSSNNRTDFYIVQKKVPAGVVLIFVGTCKKNILSIIIPVIALGNAVVLAVNGKNEFVELLLERFNKFFPKNLFSVVYGITALEYLLLDSNIAAVWMFDEVFYSNVSRIINEYLLKTSKPSWITSSNTPSSLIEKKCLKNQIIWLSKIDQFP